MSSFWLDSQDVRYTVGRPFQYEDRIYPSPSANREVFESLGFKEVVIGQRPNDRFYVVTGPGDDGAYSAVPRDHTTMVGELVVDQHDTMLELLSGSDWMVIRKVECGTEIEPEWVAYREACRNVCGRRQQSLMETKDTPELEALVTAPATVVPEIGKAGVKNPDPHLEPWPVVPGTEEEDEPAAVEAMTTTKKRSRKK